MKKNKLAKVSARISLSDKEKLQRNGYNTREAIEYFNHVATNKLEALKIEQFFLNKEIEDLKFDLIAKEMRLDDIQKQIDECHVDKLSSLRVESYQRIINLYNRDRTNQSFEEFINGRYIQENFIEKEVPMDCSMEDFCVGLLDYYRDVGLVGRTF